MVWCLSVNAGASVDLIQRRYYLSFAWVLNMYLYLLVDRISFKFKFKILTIVVSIRRLYRVVVYNACSTVQWRYMLYQLLVLVILYKDGGINMSTCIPLLILCSRRRRWEQAVAAVVEIRFCAGDDNDDCRSETVSETSTMTLPETLLAWYVGIKQRRGYIVYCSIVIRRRLFTIYSTLACSVHWWRLIQDACNTVRWNRL